MKIGLIDIDNTGFPNLALMKISAFHKLKGDEVEFVHIGNYDKTYMSKVFTYTPDYTPSLAQLNEIIKGGTGYDLTVKLPDEIENIQPDYDLYGITDTSYGFITRGCNRKCKWCVVPEKEGKPAFVNDIERLANGRKKIVIMDNNILASRVSIAQINKIIDLGLRVDFNQGLDARLVTPEIADLLSKVKWIKSVRFAVDTDTSIKPVLSAMNLLIDRGVNKWRFRNYLLLNGSIESAYKRATVMRDMGIGINPQPYRSFKENNKIPQWQKDFARWGNKRQLYDAVDFKDYKPRKNFICGSYF